MNIRTILLVLAILPTGIIRVNAQDRIDTGTVNIILANSEGVVVLTDSKETWVNAAGKAIGSTNAQKLIRLDDQTVVALAGFAGAPQFLRLDIMGILADFRNQLAEKEGKLSFNEKLRSISFLVSRYMDAFVNAREVQQPGQQASSFRMHFFIAGFDTDGAMKIGSMWLRATSTVLAVGRTRWEIGGDPDVQGFGGVLQGCKRVTISMEYCSVGYSDIADRIMDNPQSYPTVKRLLSTDTSNGPTPHIENLEALARLLSGRVAKVHSDKVGGPDQMAILQGGRIAKFDAPLFSEPPKPMTFNLIIDVHNLWFGPGGGIVSGPGVPIIWIRDTIRGYQQLILDGNFFLGTEIRDSTVRYGGKTTVFDRSNKVVNSTLWLDGLGSDAAFLHSLTHDFDWQRCLPFGCEIELPRNPPPH